MAVQSTAQIPANIVTALQKAAKLTGTDFQYLVDTAARESGFRPSVKAKTSSATGLFQFIDSTWLQMVKDKGPELGLGEAASHITKTQSGRYKVSDPARLQEILNLRKNPEVAAVMAGAFTQFNAETLEARIGREPTSGELYIAHFLGAGNGSKLIRASQVSPEMKAADLFPAAARSNKALFYKGGEAVSAKGLYQNLVRRHHTQRIDVAGLGGGTAVIPLPQRHVGDAVLSPALSGDEIKMQALAAEKTFATQVVAGVDGGVAQAGQEMFSSLYNSEKGPARDGQKTVVAGLDEPAAVAALETAGSVGVWGGVGEGREVADARRAQAAQRGPILDLKTGPQDGARGLFARGGLG